MTIKPPDPPRLPIDKGVSISQTDATPPGCVKSNGTTADSTSTTDPSAGGTPTETTCGEQIKTQPPGCSTSSTSDGPSTTSEAESESQADPETTKTTETTKPRPLIYVSGPYRADSEYGVTANIRRAGDVALSLWRAGFAVICPHKNTAGWGGVPDLDGLAPLPDSTWLDGDVVMVKRCDAIFMMPDWKSSEGAVIEHAAAEEAGLAIITGYREAQRFLSKNI